MASMDNFEYRGSPARVIFGAGSIDRLPEILKQQHLSKPLLLSTPFQVPQLEHVKDVLLNRIAGIFTEATMHTPVEVTDKAVEYAKKHAADCIVSIGGGSTIGLGKAISYRTSLPQICIPTTYAGSEMTPILGETDGDSKKTKRDAKILPGTVIYDVETTMTLPATLSCVSGMNAIAHAVEALYAPDTNPFINLMALEGVRLLSSSLPVIVKNPSDTAARRDAFHGSWLCGMCLGSTSMSLYHKLCHVVGGSFNLPHAETHTIILPHAVAYNSRAAPEAMAALAKVLPGSEGDAVHGLNMLLERLNVSRALKDLGMQEADVAKAAGLALAFPYANVRPIDCDSIQTLIHRAWAGEPANADL